MYNLWKDLFKDIKINTIDYNYAIVTKRSKKDCHLWHCCDHNSDHRRLFFELCRK